LTVTVVGAPFRRCLEFSGCLAICPAASILPTRWTAICLPSVAGSTDNEDGAAPAAVESIRVRLHTRHAHRCPRTMPSRRAVATSCSVFPSACF
jgi:hypothetical protein